MRGIFVVWTLTLLGLLFDRTIPTESALIVHRKPKSNAEKKINGFPLIMYLLGKMESMKDQLEKIGKESSDKPRPQHEIEDRLRKKLLRLARLK